jgi:uncharacterized membrane protein
MAKSVAGSAVRAGGAMIAPLDDMATYDIGRPAHASELTARSTSERRSVAAGVTLGVGLGGFVDGILLHQIVHWHNMLSARVPPVTLEAMQLNMRWDGVFHAAVWVVTLAGVFMLLRDARRGDALPSAGTLAAQMLLGWGGFNVVEGLVDHHLLDLHHVRDLPAHVPIYDWLFLLFAGVGFALAGWWGSRARIAPAATIRSDR